MFFFFLMYIFSWLPVLCFSSVKVHTSFVPLHKMIGRIIIIIFEDKCLSLFGISEFRESFKKNHSIYLFHLSNEECEALTLNNFLLSWHITKPGSSVLIGVLFSAPQFHPHFLSFPSF